METARRLGYFSLVLAFVLYVISTQAESADPALQGRLVVFRILFGLLGFILVTRYRARGRSSSRFTWIRNFLFKRSERRERKSERRGRERGRNRGRDRGSDRDRRESEA